MNTVLYSIVEQIKNISILLLPIIPISANKILDTNVRKDLRMISEINKENTLDTSKDLGDVKFYLKGRIMIIDSHCHLDYEPMFSN